MKISRLMRYLAKTLDEDGDLDIYIGNSWEGYSEVSETQIGTNGGEKSFIISDIKLENIK